ncbi:SusE domain-containing protein [Mucilaginibacter flavus]|uniref:SusE domain-containing protein n=1 Tax=Mucilaginibacter flavus TaxID=931504 RepID=UPI0025B5EB38|nr:SusE domain-containing protein [Mucilaginibacter flavus]MDN3583089.1 SusE domain-containing protein [Mucilaginibacter flavus]
MKKLLTKILAISSIGLLLLPSCKKDETRVVSNVGKAGTLTASSTTPVLTRETAANVAVTFSWPATSVTGYAAPVSYTLQIDTKGSSFKSTKLVEVALTGQTQTYTVGALNAILLGMNLSYDNTTDLEARVRSTVAANSISYTNVLTLTVKPYKLASYVYVPGAYQGWSPSTADSLKSPNSDGLFDGYIAFTPGNLEFKITPKKVWDVAYGDAGSGKVSTSGGNLSVPSAGLYELHLDLNALTFTATKQIWAVIGDATPGGWSDDTDMTYDASTKTYSVTVALIGGKQFKFRFNHAWDVNLGGSTSSLTQNGSNIDVAVSGTYKIVLDANANTFSITKQ